MYIVNPIANKNASSMNHSDFVIIYLSPLNLFLQTKMSADRWLNKRNILCMFQCARARGRFESQCQFDHCMGEPTERVLRVLSHRLSRYLLLGYAYRNPSTKNKSPTFINDFFLLFAR